MSTKTHFDLKNTTAAVLALVWALGQFGQFFGGSKLFFLDGLLVVVLGLFVFSYKGKKIYWRENSLVTLWLVMVVSFFVNIFDKNQNQLLTAFAYLTRISFIFGMYFVTLGSNKKLVKNSISLGLVIFLILSAAQYLFFPDVRAIKLLGYDDHYFRAVGTLLDPNLSSVIYIFAFYWFSDFPKKWTLWRLISLLLLALSFSRSGYLAFAVSLLFVLIKKRDLKLLYWAILLAAFVWLAPKPFGEGVNLGRTYSIEARIDNTKQNVMLPSSRLVLGNGFNFVSGQSSSDQYMNRSSGVDNSYLFLWMTTGLIGVLAFGGVIVQNYRFITDKNWALGAFTALLVHSVFNNSLFQLQILLLFVVSLGYLRIVFDEN